MPTATRDGTRRPVTTARASCSDRVSALVDAVARAYRLSGRERQVLHLTVLGACSKEVAQALDCSVKTAETYWKRLLRKLDVGCRHTFLAWIIACALEFESQQGQPRRSTDGDARTSGSP